MILHGFVAHLMVLKSHLLEAFKVVLRTYMEVLCLTREKFYRVVERRELTCPQLKVPLGTEIDPESMENP